MRAHPFFPIEYVIVAFLCLSLDAWLLVIWQQSSARKVHKQSQQRWLIWLLVGLLLVIAFLALLQRESISRSRLVDAFSFIGTLNIFGVLTFSILGLVCLVLRSLREGARRETEEAFAGLVGMIAGWIWCYWGIIRPHQFSSQRLFGLCWIYVTIFILIKVAASRIRRQINRS